MPPHRRQPLARFQRLGCRQPRRMDAADPWRDNRFRLAPEPRPDVATEGFFAYVPHQGLPCRWTTDRLRLTAPLPSNRMPAALEIAPCGPMDPIARQPSVPTDRPCS